MTEMLWKKTLFVIVMFVSIFYLIITSLKSHLNSHSLSVRTNEEKRTEWTSSERYWCHLGVFFSIVLLWFCMKYLRTAITMKLMSYESIVTTPSLRKRNKIMPKKKNRGRVAWKMSACKSRHSCIVTQTLMISRCILMLLVLISRLALSNRLMRTDMTMIMMYEVRKIIWNPAKVSVENRSLSETAILTWSCLNKLSTRTYYPISTEH